MDDLMVPVALNSSFLDIASSDIILALSFGAGIIDLIWNFVSGILMFVTEKTPKLVVLPCISLAMASLPLLWVIYLDGLLPSGRTEDMDAKIVIGVTIGMTVCCCCSVIGFLYVMMSQQVLNHE